MRRNISSFEKKICMSTLITDQEIHRSSKKDLYEAPDYYQIDELLTEEHKLVRDSVRDWVKKEVSPIIEDFAQRAF